MGMGMRMTPRDPFAVRTAVPVYAVRPVRAAMSAHPHAVRPTIVGPHPPPAGAAAVAAAVAGIPVPAAPVTRFPVAGAVTMTAAPGAPMVSTDILAVKGSVPLALRKAIVALPVAAIVAAIVASLPVDAAMVHSAAVMAATMPAAVMPAAVCGGCTQRRPGSRNNHRSQTNHNFAHH